MLEKVIAKDPDIFLAYRQLGQIYMVRSDFKKAVPVLRKAVELRSGFDEKSISNWAWRCIQAESSRLPVPEFEKVVVLAPRLGSKRSLFWATAYIKTGHAREAIAIRKGAESAPENYGACC